MTASFLCGDGLGNYYFVSTQENGSDSVKLWSHDPPGIEDQREDMESFLSSATQENPILKIDRTEDFLYCAHADNRRIRS
jgi:hypothetical protein